MLRAKRRTHALHAACARQELVLPWKQWQLQDKQHQTPANDAAAAERHYDEFGTIANAADTLKAKRFLPGPSRAAEAGQADWEHCFHNSRTCGAGPAGRQACQGFILCFHGGQMGAL